MESLTAGVENDISTNGTVNLLVCLFALVGNESWVPGGGYVYISKDENSKEGRRAAAVYMAMSTRGAYTHVIANRCIPSIPTPPSKYIICIYGSDLKNIIKKAEAQLDNISCDDSRWKPDTKMFVLLFTKMQTSKFHSVASRLIQMMWSRVVYNCAVLIMDSDGSGKIFVADPFAEENNCGRLLRSCSPAMSCPKDNSVQYKFSGPRGLFPACRISVSARATPPFSFQDDDKWQGTEVELVRTIANHLGLRIMWVDRPGDEEIDTSEMHYYYKQLSKNLIDLAIGGCVVSVKQYYIVDYLRSHQSGYLAFYVANSRPVSKWKVLYIMFPLEVWCCVVLSFAGAVGVMYLYKIWFRGVGSPSLSTLGILLQWPVKLPVHTSLRVFFISLIVPYFGLSTVYTTYLHSLTFRPPVERGVNSLRDIYDERMTIITAMPNIYRLKEIEVKKLQKLFALSLKPVLDIQNVSSILEKQRDFVILEREMNMEYLIALNGYSLRRLPYDVYHMNMALVVPEGSLFKESLDKLILMCLEFGLFLKWKSDVMRNAKIKRSKYTDGEVEGPRALDLSDLHPAFQILFVGLGLSILVSILEVVVHGRQKINSQLFKKETPENKRFSFRH